MNTNQLNDRYGIKLFICKRLNRPLTIQSFMLIVGWMEYRVKEGIAVKNACIAASLAASLASGKCESDNSNENVLEFL